VQADEPAMEPTYRDREDTLRRASADFPADLASAGEARSFVGALCRNWGVPNVLLDAEMVVSELVENAVRHSHSGCDVMVELAPGTLTIGASDRGTHPPRLLRPPPDQPGGRGLLLVDTVSRRWGFEPTRDGKVVWADLAVV
jgi:anti-sigma regulatory factor (Ser/Thr protein kinase)